MPVGALGGKLVRPLLRSGSWRPWLLRFVERREERQKKVRLKKYGMQEINGQERFGGGTKCSFYIAVRYELTNN